MTDFMIRFILSNLLIAGLAGILLLARRLFCRVLSERMQYRLWFLFLALLILPFLPFPASGLFFPFFPFGRSGVALTDAGKEPAWQPVQEGFSSEWMDDFTLSVSNHTSDHFGWILFTIWIIGMLLTLFFTLSSLRRLGRLKRSALPLQDPDIQDLYKNCLEEMHIAKNIPLFSTAFLKTPLIVGIFKPAIYIPIAVIRECRPMEIRYMLLHELEHYRHKDGIAGGLMTLAGILYWLNPAVRFALKEMRGDREIACDASVLKRLDPTAYEEYGCTLLNFAARSSHSPFPFSAGLGAGKKLLERRILHIAAYERPSFNKKIKSGAAFLLTALLLLLTAPGLSAYGSDDSHYHWQYTRENLTIADLSAAFNGYDGSFVLYDLAADRWTVYNMDQALTRSAPDSTYKIYDALFALEEGVITPQDSLIRWDGTNYPFGTWNTDQTLRSAMTGSVNWYFQTLDAQMGRSVLTSRIREIGYGNGDISGSLSSYWLESSLQISPAEQVLLLKSMYANDFDFRPENIQAVKDALRLDTDGSATLYGKTGTGQVNGLDVNGWFVGFVERAEGPSFFALRIASRKDATGSQAAQITLSLLDEMDIFHAP